MGASDRRKLWICRFAWTTQTRCPHTHSSDRKKRRKRLEDSFEEEENRNGRRLYTLISTVPGPSDGGHLRLSLNFASLPFYKMHSLLSIFIYIFLNASSYIE